MIDVWGALRTDRPYRKAWPDAEALDYIGSNPVVLFDPEVVERFLSRKDFLRMDEPSANHIPEEKTSWTIFARRSKGVETEKSSNLKELETSENRYYQLFNEAPFSYGSKTLVMLGNSCLN